MISKRENGLLSQMALVTNHVLSLGDGERVAEMKATVHVRVRENGLQRNVELIFFGEGERRE